jgi:hypothetical protein
MRQYERGRSGAPLWWKLRQARAAVRRGLVKAPLFIRHGEVCWVVDRAGNVRSNVKGHKS